MKTVTIDESTLKVLLKSALIEALEDSRNLVQDIVEEAIEDIGLAHAIERGLSTNTIPRDTVFKILQSFKVPLWALKRHLRFATSKYEILLFWSQEDQACIAEVPELPGCMADGRTYQEALSNVDTCSIHPVNH